MMRVKILRYQLYTFNFAVAATNLLLHHFSSTVFPFPRGPIKAMF